MHEEDGVWSEPSDLVQADHVGSVSRPTIVVDDRGRSVAVWAATHGAGTAIWAARHDGRVWTEPERLDVEYRVKDLRLTAGDDGFAALWLSEDFESTDSVTVATLLEGEWETETVATGPDGGFLFTRLAFGAGSWVASWITEGGSRELTATTFSDEGWSTPQGVDDDGLTGLVLFASSAGSDEGVVVAYGKGEEIRAAAFDGQDWTNAFIDDVPDGFSDLVVGRGGDDSLSVIFASVNGGDWSVEASTFDGTTFSSPIVLNDPLRTERAAALATAPLHDGLAIAWTQRAGGGTFDVFAAQLLDGVADFRRLTPAEGAHHRPIIASEGDSFAVAWETTGGDPAVSARQFDEGTWGAAEELSAGGRVKGVDISRYGDHFAVLWREDIEGETGIFVARPTDAGWGAPERLDAPDRSGHVLWGALVPFADTPAIAWVDYEPNLDPVAAFLFYTPGF